MARESHSTSDDNRGSIVNFGPQNGVSVVGDRAVVIQTKDGGAATGDTSLRPAEPAAVAPEPWRFVLREDAARRTRAHGPLATLEVHSPHAPGQRLEWPVEPRVPTESRQLELDWYFRQQWQDRDPTRANEIEQLLGRLGDELFASLFSDDEARRYWRNAFESGHEIVWNIQGSPRFHRSPWELLRHVHNGLEYDVAPAEEETGWLLFADERRRDPASATEVARMISQARIPIVVLNACDSAAVPEADSSSGWSDSSSLTARLVEAGGFSAVGFSNALSLPGAQRFFGEFYRTLVRSPDRGRLDQAVIRGRQALHERRERRGIQLIDWSLPVWYTSRDVLAPAE